MANVQTEVSGHVLTITLNRPDAMNALNEEVSRGVASAMLGADANDGIRAVVLTGAGDKVFCAGADLKALSAGEQAEPKAGPESEFGLGGHTRKTISKPVIVAANGSAYGGGLELMLQADVIIVEKGRKFALPEVKRGIFAAAGGAIGLTEVLPRGVVMDMLLTGEPVSAERLFELGFASRLVEPGEARAMAAEVAAGIAANAPLGVRESKRLARGMEGLTREELWRANDDAFAAILNTEDAKEGPRAFAEKRAPVWSGR